MEEQVLALKELLGSTGWKMLLAFADEQAGPLGYSRQVQHVMASTPPGPDSAYQLQQALQRVHAVAAAINQLTNWPRERLNALVPPAKTEKLFEAFRRSTR